MDSNELLQNYLTMSQVNSKNVSPEFFLKFSKHRTMLQFELERAKNPKGSQKEICDAIGVSVSTFNRIRKDLKLPSPFRYSSSDKSEAARERDKYKRIVYDAFKSGKINEATKTELYRRINSNLDSEVKDEVMKLKLKLKQNNRNKNQNEVMARVLRGGTNEDRAGTTLHTSTAKPTDKDLIAEGMAIANSINFSLNQNL